MPPLTGQARYLTERRRGDIPNAAVAPEVTTKPRAQNGQLRGIDQPDIIRLLGYPIHQMRHLPDGRLLAASAANGVLLLDGQTGHLDLLRWHPISPTPGISYGEFPTVSTLTLSRDGRLLATGGHEDRPTIRVWDLTTRRQVHKLQHPAGQDVFGLAFSPDGTQLVSGAYWDEDGGGACCVWELATPASDRSHQN